MKNLSKVFNLKVTFTLMLFIELFSLSLNANPGDTTWVTIYNNRKLTQYGNIDTTASFPTGMRFRKIRLHYILGRYACPSGTQYCGSWDYTTMVYARPAGMDSVEIARIITPYATDWLASNKKHDYIVDVTDYAKALEGNTAMRFKYEGYSWGFTLTLKLEMIEGIPAMDALSVKKVYDGYFAYGNNANPIENSLIPKSFTYAAPVNRVFFKNTVSGHGSDATGCGEFCSKYYRLKVDNNMISQKQLWRADCGINNVYPQTGTWLFERANWCPGAVVWPIYHDLSAVTTANTTYTVDVDMQPYTAGSNWGGYSFSSQIINYSQPNQSLDLSIEDIVAPNKDPNYARSNPRCTNPIIKIKNTGTTPITSAEFSYGLSGASPISFTWTGNLNFLEETEVALQPLTAVSLTNTADTKFNVSVVSVNGSAGDGNLFNNIYQSVAAPVSIYPDTFVVRMMTNNSTDLQTQTNETSWTLYDDYDNVIASRTGLSNNTLYLDTIALQPGCYRFTLEDKGCDGYQWWYYQYYTPNPGNGTCKIEIPGTFSTVANFSGDFGCGYTKYFKVLAPPSTVGIRSYVSDNNIEVYPNPAQNTIYIKLDLNNHLEVSYKVSDVNGKIIQQKSLGKMSAGYEAVDVSQLNNGVYFVGIQLGNGPVITKKAVIQR
jgi:hypothetical protein